MPALVLDGNENQAVATTRSLGRAGHHVTVGAPTRWSKAGWSRYAGGSIQYPAPQVDAAAFVQCVVEAARRTPGTLVLPMTERSTLPLSEHREELQRAAARFVLPDHATVLRAFDKHAMSTLAGQLGIEVPRSILLPAGQEPRVDGSE